MRAVVVVLLHESLGARVRVLEAQTETWTDRDGVFRLVVPGVKDDPVTLRVDQGEGWTEDQTVTLGQTHLGLAVRRRP